jgi:hypothetical protein
MIETEKKREDTGCCGNKRDNSIILNVIFAIPQGGLFLFWAREIAFVC